MLPSLVKDSPHLDDRSGMPDVKEKYRSEIFYIYCIVKLVVVRKI